MTGPCAGQDRYVLVIGTAVGLCLRAISIARRRQRIGVAGGDLGVA
jgi:hypothetical protein